MQNIEKNGWISLHRKIKKNWVWDDRPFTKGQAWIDIILECNHEGQKVNIGNEILICGRGESVKSLKTWAKAWGWNVSKVRRFLKLLENDSMIELKSAHNTTHLKVCNYETYQNNRNEDETNMKQKRNESETKVKTNNNDNNVNNDNNTSLIGEDERIFPTKGEVREYFEFENATQEEADVFYSHYEVKDWYVLSNDGIRHTDIANRKWKIKADEWIKKNRIKKIEKENDNGFKPSYTGKGQLDPDNVSRMLNTDFEAK